MNKCNFIHEDLYMGLKSFHTKTYCVHNHSARCMHAYITQLYMHEHTTQRETETDRQTNRQRDRDRQTEKTKN